MGNLKLASRTVTVGCIKRKLVHAVLLFLHGSGGDLHTAVALAELRSPDEARVKGSRGMKLKQESSLALRSSPALS